jgi:hypothetical protein
MVLASMPRAATLRASMATPGAMATCTPVMEACHRAHLAAPAKPTRNATAGSCA